MRLFEVNILCYLPLLEIYNFMQQSQVGKNPFDNYKIRSADLSLLHAIKQPSPQLKTNALIHGCLIRNSKKLYRGNKQYYDDLQIILDHDRENSPQLLKKSNIVVNRDQTDVLVQCNDCAKFNLPYKFCEKCDNCHYCSSGCEVRSKIDHQKQCRPKILPAMDTPLQVQIHIGSDLGKNVQVYFQHQMRMSLLIRGENFINNIYNYFNSEGKSFISQNYGIELANKHFVYKKLQEQNYVGSDNNFVADSLDKLVKIYKNNAFLGHIELYLLQRGGILIKQIKQIHNNHLHIVYVFLCCQ